MPRTALSVTVAHGHGGARAPFYIPVRWFPRRVLRFIYKTAAALKQHHPASTSARALSNAFASARICLPPRTAFFVCLPYHNHPALSVPAPTPVRNLYCSAAAPDAWFLLTHCRAFAAWLPLPPPRAAPVGSTLWFTPTRARARRVAAAAARFLPPLRHLLVLAATPRRTYTSCATAPRSPGSAQRRRVAATSIAWLVARVTWFAFAPRSALLVCRSARAHYLPHTCFLAYRRLPYARARARAAVSPLRFAAAFPSFRDTTRRSRALRATRAPHRVHRRARTPRRTHAFRRA